MVDFRKIAIADCLVHPIFGVVSFQPRFHDGYQERIRVRDRRGYFYHVAASECSEASYDQTYEYWQSNKPKLKYGEGGKEWVNQK